MSLGKYWKESGRFERVSIIVLFIDLILFIAAVAEKFSRNNDLVVDNLKLAILASHLIMFICFLINKREMFDRRFLFAFGMLLLTIFGLLIYNYSLFENEEEEAEDEMEEDDLKDHLLEDGVSIVITIILNLVYLFIFLVAKHFRLIFASTVIIMFELISIIAAINQTTDRYIDVANLTSIMCSILVAILFYTGKVQIDQERERFETYFEIVRNDTEA
jgi:dipeptide/tripeptide permease